MKHPLIIFLDIDGVLNNTDYAARMYDQGTRLPIYHMDPGSVTHFNRAVSLLANDYMVRIVISSTWRKYCTHEEIQAQLGTPAANIIPSGENWRTPTSNHGIRGREVADYMYTVHKEDHTDNHPQYVCIDDDGDFFHHQPLFQTNHKRGFQKEHIGLLLDFVRSKHTHYRDKA